jgi:ribosome-associated protein
VNISDLLPGILTEVRFLTSRSSGPGGQNVNKVNSKVTLVWDVRDSHHLSEEQRSVILAKAARHITREGLMMLVAQDCRSQVENKQTAIRKLAMLLEKVSAPVKKRKATKPTQASARKRLESKKHRADVKAMRGKVR